MIILLYLIFPVVLDKGTQREYFTAGNCEMCVLALICLNIPSPNIVRHQTHMNEHTQHTLAYTHSICDKQRLDN